MIITNGQGDDESAVKPVPTTRKDADKARLEMHCNKHLLPPEANVIISVEALVGGGVFFPLKHTWGGVNEREVGEIFFALHLPGGKNKTGSHTPHTRRCTKVYEQQH